MVMSINEPVGAEFQYWASHRSPDISEVLDIVNGTSPDVKSYECQVYNIRPSYQQYDLDNHAFCIFKHSSSLLPPRRSASTPFSFENSTQLTEQYYPELRKALTAALLPRSVIPFNAVARTSTSELHSQPGTTKPFFVVHCDYSHVGSREVLRNVAPSFFEDLKLESIIPEPQRLDFFRLRKEILYHEELDIKHASAVSHLDWDGANYSGPRWCIYSVWRPLEKVMSDPLAVLNPQSSFTAPDFELGHYNNNLDDCTLSSIAPHGRSFMQIRLPHKNRPGFHPDYENQNMMTLNPATPGYREQLLDEGKQHQWLYLKEQEPDEVLIIKIFDSDAWVKGKRGKVMPGAGHSAFKLPGQDRDQVRRSVEVRFIVIY